MPTYEYVCKDCGEHLEVVQSFKDAALKECGRCGGELRKVFSAAGIIFKGSGYYVTDSRSKPADSDKPAKSGTEGASKTSSDSDSASTPSKSESKTDSKTDSKKSTGSESGGGTAKSA